MIQISNLNFSIQQKEILKNLNLSIEEGSFTAIIGPNGAGKSTLIHHIAGGIDKYQGSIKIKGVELSNYKILELALDRAVLSQQNTIQFPIDVIDVIALGRQPFQSLESPQQTQRAIDFGIQTWGLENFCHRKYQSLSGGEKQKVQFARIWTQIYANEYSGKYLLIDEPLTYLDIYHQLEFMDKLQMLKKRGLTIIGVFHQLDIALQNCEEVVIIDRGSIGFHGTPTQLYEKQIIPKVFQVNAFQTQTINGVHTVFELPRS